MVCPKCKVEAVITGSRMVYNKKDEKAYRVLKYSCRNKKCEKYNKVIGEERRVLPLDDE